MCKIDKLNRYVHVLYKYFSEKKMSIAFQIIVVLTAILR